MLKIPPQCQDLVTEVLKTAAAQVQVIINEPVDIILLEPLSLEIIMETVCRELGVSEAEVRGRSRKEPIKDARHLVCFYSRQTKAYSLKAIASWLNYDDHTPVIHACHRIQDMIDTQDEVILAKLNQCKTALLNAQINNLTHP